MSGIWGEMLDKGIGDNISKEEFSKIYYGSEGKKTPIVTVDEDDHRGYHYDIKTDGDFPSLVITTDSTISAFSGHDSVILKFTDGKKYELDRIVSGSKTRYEYSFCKEGDYTYDMNQTDMYTRENEGKESGHKYSVQEIKKYAEMFIDKIIECEDEKYKHTD